MSSKLNKNASLSVACFTFVLFFVSGFAAVQTTLYGRMGFLTIPGALAMPHDFPGFRLSAVGTQTKGTVVLNSLLAIGIAVFVGSWLWHSFKKHQEKQQDMGRTRLFFSAWGAVLVAFVVTNILRETVFSYAMEPTLGVYLVQVAGSAVMAMLWSIVVGPLVGAVAVLARFLPDRKKVKTAPSPLPAN